MSLRFMDSDFAPSALSLRLNEALEESLIRDSVVLGVPDVAVRKRLLQESDLTLSRAIAVVQAHEATL